MSFMCGMFDAGFPQRRAIFLKGSSKGSSKPDFLLEIPLLIPGVIEKHDHRLAISVQTRMKVVVLLVQRSGKLNENFGDRSDAKI